MRQVFNFDPEWRFHLGDVQGTKKNSHYDAYYVTKAGKQFNQAARSGMTARGRWWICRTIISSGCPFRPIPIFLTAIT